MAWHGRKGFNSQNMSNYKFKIPSLYKGLDEDAAVKELERIAEKCGALTPEILVAESRDDNAVLHGIFEWDDAKAAEGYRREQARKFLTNITYEVQREEVTITARLFVNTYTADKPDERTYNKLPDVIKDKVAYKDLLEQAKRDAQNFVVKYAQLSEIGGVKIALQKFVAGIFN